MRRQEAVILTTQDLEKIADLTLEHYNRRAEDFWQGTRDHDVGQNIEALLRYIGPEGAARTAALAGQCLAQTGVRSLHHNAAENRP